MLSLKQLTNIASHQKAVDEHIFNNNHCNRLATQRKRLVSFIVELCEFINEDRGFKFWSHKKASARKVLLEEYADALHFIISLGLDLEFDFKQVNIMQFKKHQQLDKWEQFLMLVHDFSLFTRDYKQSIYQNLLEHFLTFGYEQMQFTGDEIEHAYLAKAEINHQRQKEHY